jgi:hypothetical protein
MRRVQDQAETRRVLEERAQEAGFDLVGVARAEPLREGGERLREWQEAGMAADMGYMHRPVELLSDPKKLQKSARSVVSLGVSYYPGDHPENEGGGRVARYAWGLDYHEVIKGKLFRLREDLEEELGVRIGALRGPARGARFFRAELLPDKQRDRVVFLYSGPDRGPRPRPRSARRRNLRTLYALHGQMPHRCHKGPRRRGRQALYLVPHDREPG